MKFTRNIEIYSTVLKKNEKSYFQAYTAENKIQNYGT